MFSVKQYHHLTADAAFDISFPRLRTATDESCSSRVKHMQRLQFPHRERPAEHKTPPASDHELCLEDTCLPKRVRLLQCHCQKHCININVNLSVKGSMIFKDGYTNLAWETMCDFLCPNHSSKWSANVVHAPVEGLCPPWSCCVQSAHPPPGNGECAPVPDGQKPIERMPLGYKSLGYGYGYGYGRSMKWPQAVLALSRFRSRTITYREKSIHNIVHNMIECG